MALTAFAAFILWAAPLGCAVRRALKDGICCENVGMLSIAMEQYAADHDETYPLAASWMDSAEAYRFGDGRPVDRRNERCPMLADSHPGAYGYALNAASAGKKRSVTPDWGVAPLVFESTLLGRNAVSGVETIPKKGRHRGKSYVGYGDRDAAIAVPDGQEP